MLSRFFLNTRDSQIIFTENVYKLNRHWLEFMALLVLHRLEGKGFASVSDIQTLPDWHRAALTSIGTSVFRQLNKWRKHGLDVVVSPPEQQTKSFMLFGSLEVQCDLETDELRRWLGFRTTILLDTDAYEGQRLMLIAQSYFERGIFDEADKFARLALTHELLPDFELRVWSLLTMIESYIGNQESSYNAITQLQQRLRQLEPVRPETRAWVYCQVARHMYKYATKREARLLYEQAARLLEPHHYRELGAIEFGLAMSTSGKQLEVQRKHFVQAYQYYLLADWRWAATCQLENIGTTLVQLAREKKGKQRIALLEEAVLILKRCVDIADALDLNAGVHCEINLARALRLLGQTQEAKEYLEKAERLADYKKLPWDLAMVYLEQSRLLEDDPVAFAQKFAQGEAYAEQCGRLESYLKVATVKD